MKSFYYKWFLHKTCLLERCPLANYHLTYYKKPQPPRGWSDLFWTSQGTSFCRMRWGQKLDVKVICFFQVCLLGKLENRILRRAGWRKHWLKLQLHSCFEFFSFKKKFNWKYRSEQSWMLPVQTNKQKEKPIWAGKAVIERQTSAKG